MTFVLGRDGGLADGPAGRLGSYRAHDGSGGADRYLDLTRSHAALVVGERGDGTSCAPGVIAEPLAGRPTTWIATLNHILSVGSY